MIEFLSKPWPWYFSGPLIGLMIPLLLLIGNKHFGVSSSFRHICAIALPKWSSYFKYDWKKETWNLVFVFGIAIGGLLANSFLNANKPIQLAEETKTDLSKIGITNFEGYVPSELFTFENISSPPIFFLLVIGGFLVGFGTRYADGCTSGHSIMGLSLLSLTSLIATLSFFIGGLISTHLIYPLLFNN